MDKPIDDANIINDDQEIIDLDEYETIHHDNMNKQESKYDDTESENHRLHTSRAPEKKAMSEIEKFKKNDYLYPIDFIYTLRGEYKDILSDLKKKPIIPSSFKPNISKYTQYDEGIDEEEEFESKIKILVGKIESKNFDNFSTQLNNMNTNNREKLKILVMYILLGATTQSLMYIELYAKLCIILKNKTIEFMNNKDEIVHLSFIMILIKELKNKFDSEILIDPEDAVKYESNEIGEYDLKDHKDKKIKLMTFIGELFNHKLLKIDILNICLDNMLKVINKCNDNKHIKARDVIMDCMIEFISIFGKTHFNKNKYDNVQYAKLKNIIEECRNKGKKYPIKRLSFKMDAAMKIITPNL